MHVVNKFSQAGRRSKPGKLSREEAETIALQGLVFLSGDNSRMARFLSLTGLGPDEVRGNVQEPWFLTAILDHLMSDESLLLVFCAENSIDPASVGPARRLLAPEDGEAF